MKEIKMYLKTTNYWGIVKNCHDVSLIFWVFESFDSVFTG